MASTVTAFDEDRRAQREHKNASSDLLKLPAELKNRIYMDVFEIDPLYHRSIVQIARGEGILRTSRQLRKETQPILYGCKIIFWGWDTVIKTGIPWLHVLSSKAVSYLRHLEFDVIALCPGHQDGRTYHHLSLTVDPDSHNSRYKLECYDYMNGVGSENCSAVKRVDRKIVPVLERLKTDQDREGFKRKDLLALMEIMKKLQSRRSQE